MQRPRLCPPSRDQRRCDTPLVQLYRGICRRRGRMAVENTYIARRWRNRTKIRVALFVVGPARLNRGAVNRLAESTHFDSRRTIARRMVLDKCRGIWWPRGDSNTRHAV